MIYLDHAATSAIRPAAREAVGACWDAGPGNSMSQHRAGRAARAALEGAREQVAALVGALPSQVFFTAGATESSNIAIRGLAAAAPGKSGRAVSTRIEHSATRRACEALSREGWAVTLLAVDHAGLVDPAELARSLTPETRLVSIIGGHNELGTLQRLTELARVAHSGGALFHVDAVQAAGTTDLSAIPWDMLSLSAHKLGGPQGVGALVVRGRPDLAPVLVGGKQEDGLRPGSVPVALACGFGAAAAEVLTTRSAERLRLADLRDRLGQALLGGHPGARPLGCWHDAPERALPHVLSLGFPGFQGDELVWALDREGILASSSSACHGDARSHVMTAIGLPEDFGPLRLSLGWCTSAEDVARAVPRILAALEALGRMSAFERRRGPLEAKAADCGLALTAAHLAAAEAVYEFYRKERILPGARYMSRVLGNGTKLAHLYPHGMATLAGWLGLPVPAGGCKPATV